MMEHRSDPSLRRRRVRRWSHQTTNTKTTKMSTRPRTTKTKRPRYFADGYQSVFVSIQPSGGEQHEDSEDARDLQTLGLTSFAPFYSSSSTRHRLPLRPALPVVGHIHHEPWRGVRSSAHRVEPGFRSVF